MTYLTYETVWAKVGSGLLISMLGILNLLHLTIQITGVSDIKTDRSALDKKMFQDSGIDFLFLNWIGVLTLFLLIKLLLRRVDPLIHSMKFSFLWSSPLPLKSSMWHWMESWCHACIVTPSCYLDLLGKLHKWVCRTVGPTLAAFLESLFNCWNVASINIFCWYYFDRYSSELAELVALLHSFGWFTWPVLYK